MQRLLRISPQQHFRGCNPDFHKALCFEVEDQVPTCNVMFLSQRPWRLLPPCIPVMIIVTNLQDSGQGILFFIYFIFHFWAELEQGSAAALQWAPEMPADSSHGLALLRGTAVTGMPRQGQLAGHSRQEQPVYLGKWDAALGLLHTWKITVCQRGEEDRNFSRLPRKRAQPYRFPLELCVQATARNREAGHPLWLLMLGILLLFFYWQYHLVAGHRDEFLVPALPLNCCAPREHSYRPVVFLPSTSLSILPVEM